MTKLFSLASPFTFEHAKRYEGQHARVTCSDYGLQTTYWGKISYVSVGKTKVGDEVLMNDAIVKVMLGE